jgi:hypothetical protein
MSGIASAIIIPPSSSNLNKVAAGFSGTESSRRVSVVQAIAQRREDVPHQQAAFHPDDSEQSLGRDHREVRQLAIQPGTQNGARTGSRRGIAAGPTREGQADLREFGGASFASIQFLAQVIGQSEEPSSGPLAYHPDGAALGSEAYRRAGAAPPHYPEQPTIFRVAI